MNKDTSSGRISPRLLLVILVTFCITLASLAFTSGSGNEAKIASEGRQEASLSPSSVSVLYNNATPLHLHFLPAVPALVNHGANGAGNSPIWQSIAVLPGPAADGSNQLRLYDADFPQLPAGLSPHNVATQSNSARNGDWHARIDAEGGVWVWIETTELAEGDDETANRSKPAKMEGLPPINTLALGGGHAVGLTQGGEVWTWEIAPGTYPSGAAPPSQPAKLSGLPEIVSIGAWREYGFAKSDDGTLWLWQGVENKYAALTDEELAAAIGILTKNTPAQNTLQSATTTQSSTSTSLAIAAPIETSATPATLPTGGLRLWLKADVGVITDVSGKINQWQDQSGLNNHATQSTAARQPQLTHALDGLPAVTFSAASSQYFTLPNFMSGVTEGEVFIVTRATAATPATVRALWRFGSEANGSYYPHTNSTLQDSFGSNTLKNTAVPGADLSKWHLYNVSTTSGEWISRLNGVPQYRTATNTVAWQTAPFLGRGNTYYYDGDIVEILIYDRVLSETERKAVEACLVSRGQFTISTPATPTALNATAIDATQASVSWSADIIPWTTFELQRSIEAGAFQTIAQTPSASYVDRDLTAGVSVRYRVRAATPMGASAWGNKATLTTPSDTIGLFPAQNLRLWLKADSEPLGPLSTWRDFSTIGNTVNAPTLASRPQVTQDAQGRKAVSFAAASSQYVTLQSFMSGAVEGEVFIVTRAAAATPATIRSIWRFGSESNGSYYPHSNGTVYDSFGSSALKNTTAPGTDLTEWHLYNASTASGGWTSRFNGLVQHRATTNTVEWQTAPFLGRGNTYYYDGDIAEILVFDRVLADAERKTVETYLAIRCQLAVAPLTAPTGIRATALDANHAGIAWNAATTPWTTFELQRSIEGGAYQTIARTSSASYLDSNLAAGISARYRVRASTPMGVSAWSGEITVTPPAITIGTFPMQNLRLWLKADSSPLGLVSSWRDLGTSANTVIAPGLANRPQVTQDVQGRKAVGFAAASSQYFTLSPVMADAAEGEVFVVTRAATSTPAAIRSLWRFGSESNGSYYPNTNGTLRDSFGSSTLKTTDTPASDITQWHIYNASSETGAWSSRINGAWHFSTTTNVVAWSATPYLGRGNSYYYDGDIAEVLVFDRVLTEAERNLVGRYLYAQTQPPAITLPATPQPLQVQCSGAGEAWITWPASETSIPSAGYILERQGSDNQWHEIASLPQSSTFHLDRGLAPGAYGYRLKARSWAGDAAYGNTASVTVTAAAPANIPADGLRLWLRTDLGVATDGTGAVEQWADLSGQANHAVQATAASRPAFTTAPTDDARPVIRFTRATQQKLELPSALMTGATAGDAFVILRANAIKPASHTGLWRIGNAVGYYPNTSAALTDSFGSSTARDLGTAQADITQRHLLEITSIPGQWLARLNGLEQTRADTNSVAWSTAPLLGHNGSSTYAFDGDVEEVIIYDRALTNAEREQVRLHLNARHQLASAAPETPSSLQASPGVQGGIELAWDAASEVIWTEYIIERSANNGAFEEIARTEWHNFTDATAQPDTAYIYRVKARNWFGKSGYATTDTPLTITAADALPAMPSRENLRLWLRADHGVFASTSDATENRVQRWQDQSGSGNHAVQLAPASRPLLVPDTETGAPALRFTAAQKQSLSFLNVMQGATAAEIIIRVKTSAATYTADNGLWKWSASGAAYPSKTATLTDGSASNANQFQGAPVLDINQWRTYSISATAGQWVSRLDGLEQYNVATNTPSFITTPLLGSNGSAYFDGDITEILVFDRVFTAGEREQLTRYLDARANPGGSATAPDVPSGLTATAESATSIVVRWTPPAGIDDSLTYILERRAGVTGTFEEILRTANGYATRSDYTDRNLAPGTAYAYRLKARNSAGVESAYSSLAAATTLAVTPADSTWPADIAPANLRLWLRADVGLVRSQGGSLVEWEDQSGNANHAAQPLVANQPAAGQNAVTFDAAKCHVLTLPATLFTGVTSGDIFVVLKNVPSTAHRGLWTFGTGANYYLQNTNSITESAGTSTARVLGAPIVDTSAWHVYNVTATSGQWIARLNGFEQLRDETSNTIKWSTVPKLGQGTAYYHGDIAELIVYDRVLTSGERERITRHLQARHTALPSSAAPPVVPSGLAALSETPGSAFVKWTQPGDLVAGVTYTLERRIGSSGEYVPVLTYAAGNAQHADFTDTGLAPGSTATYRFSARDQIGRETVGSQTATVTVAAGATPGTLAQTDGLRLWLRSDRGIAASPGGRIALWQDQSGSGNHASQTVPANRPTAGQESVVFDAVQSQVLNLPADLMTGAIGGEAFVVLKAAAASGANRGLWTVGPSGNYYPQSTGDLGESFGASALRSLAKPVINIAAWHAYNVAADAASWVVRLNGLEQNRLDAANTVKWSAAPKLGQGSAYFAGDVAEILIYDHVLTTAEREGVVAYLNTRYPVLPSSASAPQAPLGLYAESDSPGTAHLGWTLPGDVAIGVTYTLERRVGDSGGFAAILSFAHGNTLRADHTDHDVSAGQTYTYRLQARDQLGRVSAYSNLATVTIPAAAAPGTLTQADGLRLWLRADRGILTSPDGGIAVWEDQSGLNNHATQTAAATQPVPAAAEDIAARATVAFNPAAKHQFTLPAALMTGATAGEAFVVLKVVTTTPAAIRSLWRMGYSSYSYYPNRTGILQDDFGNSASRSLGTPAADITRWHTYHVSSQPGEWVASIDGGELFRAATNTVRWAAAPLLGTNGSYYLEGEIAEVLVFDRVLTASQRTTVLAYLEARKSATPASWLPVPSNPSATATAWDQVTLTWTAASDCAYDIERLNPDGMWETVARVLPGVDSYTDSGLRGDYAYTYRIRAVRGANISPYTAGYTVSTPAAPGGDDTRPVAYAQSITLQAGTTIPVQLAASDPAARELLYAVTGAPSHGTLGGAAPSLTYTAAPGYVGSDTIAFTVNNGLASATATVALTVIEADSDTTTTHVALEPPAGTIAAPTAITGWALHPKFLSYELQVRPETAVTTTAWTTVQRGVRRVGTVSTSATAGTLDPALLRNGPHQLRIVVTIEGGGAVTSSTVRVLVDSRRKSGLFTVSFKDITVPLAGIPIEIVRTYDNRDRAASGDFGHGWNLDVNTVKLAKSGPLYQGWMQVVSGFGQHSLVPTVEHLVAVILPDGTQATFKAVTSPPDMPSAPLDMNSFTLSFTPCDSRTKGTLALDTSATFYVSGPGTGVNGAATLVTSQYGSAPYNPARFRYTDASGTLYIVDEATGLVSMKDVAGNTLAVTRDNTAAKAITRITHTVASQSTILAITRDTQGRVTTITPPFGEPLRYTYDAAGDLATFTDRSGAVTAYSYHTRSPDPSGPDQAHLLRAITDPEGNIVLLNEYDALCRLSAQTDARGNTITYDLTAANQEKITDRLGNVTVHTYDEADNLVSTLAPDGGLTRYEYTDADNPAAVTARIDPLGRVTRYEYDAAGRLLKETNPLGHATSIVYNASGQPTHVTDALNRATVTTYASGRPSKVTDAAGGITQYFYDTRGNLNKTIDPLGQVTTMTYGSYDRLATQTGPDGVVTTYAYDANGHLLSQARAKGGLTETTAYVNDPEGRVLETHHPGGGVTTTDYNANGKPILTTDPAGRSTAYEYDDAGNLIKTTHYPASTAHGETPLTEETYYDAENHPVLTKDRAHQWTRTDYDNMGRAIASYWLGVHATAEAALAATPQLLSTTVYDLAGQVTQTIDTAGNTTTYTYDAAGRRLTVTSPGGAVTTSAYDAVGNLTTVTDPRNLTTTHAYDALNRRTRTDYPDGTATQAAYDALGRKTSDTDAENKTTACAYNAAGQLTTVTDAACNDTAYGYDALGRQVSQTDAEGRTTQYAYDTAGRRHQRTLPAGQIETLTYTDDGALATRTDFNGETTAYAYDGHGRLLAVTPSAAARDRGALATVKTYDFAGRLTRVEQRDAADTVVWAENHLYNERGRLRKKETTAGILTYAYDAADRLESITTSRGTATAYAYDTDNRLATATDQDNGATTYSYNASGSLDTVTLPNGVATEYTYNVVNRLTAIVTQKGANTLATFAYTLRDSGHRSQLQETINGVSRTTDWTYDILYRLTGETVNNTATVNYTYDKVGNRQSRTGSGSGGTGVPPVGLYDYDLNDRLLSADTRNYTYDANGNTLTGHAHTAGINHLTGLSLTAQTVTDTYDHANRLIKRTAPGQTITILYDADGNRVAKTINGATTYYLVDTSNPTGYAQVIEEIKDGVVQKRYNYGLDLISQQHRQTNGTYATRYYAYDGLGSVRYLTNNAGGITDRYVYDGYGTLLDKWSSGTTADNVYLYAGEQYDPDLGLYYNRARYLNTDTGRFWSMDEFEGFNMDPQSLHKYLYVHGNPASGIDPSGRNLISYANYTAGTANLTINIITKIAFPIAARIASRGTMVWGWLLAIGGVSVHEALDATNQLMAVQIRVKSNPTKSSYAYKNYKCVEFTSDAMEYFKKKGKKPERIIYRSNFQRTVRDFISAAHGFGIFSGQNISTNGQHQGVLVDGMVYDNNVPFGAARLAWESGYEVVSIPEFQEMTIGAAALAGIGTITIQNF